MLTYVGLRNSMRETDQVHTTASFRLGTSKPVELQRRDSVHTDLSLKGRCDGVVEAINLCESIP